MNIIKSAISAILRLFYSNENLYLSKIFLDTCKRPKLFMLVDKTNKKYFIAIWKESKDTFK